MSDVKWIKLNTHMFEDEKIKLIEQMPDADTILVIWIKLLSQAGKTNASGYIFLSEKIPYTDEMLATIFNRPLNTVRMALDVFRNFGMIEMDDNNFISISNWEKHQNIAGLEKIREQNRKRVAKHREQKKLEQNDDVTLHVTQGNATEEEKNKSKKKNNGAYTEEFEEFWKAYPRKIDKKRGFKSFNSRVKHHSPNIIIKGAEGYARYVKKEKTETKFIKHASTFLNNDSFLDFLNEEEPKRAPNQQYLTEEDMPY